LYEHDDTKDADLFLRFQQGDPAAADTLFLRHVKPLCFFVERITGSGPDAQDIVADTFIKLLEHRGQFQNMDNVRAFLYRVARNAAINFHLAGTRHRAAHEQIGYLNRADEGREHWLDNEQVRAEVLGAIYQEIEDLPGKCREIFKAIFIQGLSNEEIASRMGIAVQTVRTQKARAISLLRAQLLKKGQLLALLYLVDYMSSVHA
jgi:RNA polymerase sigma-70 factor (family 1)